jgi:hypothetical protein
MIINLTPHTVNINDIIYTASGTVARVSQTNIIVGNFDGIDLIKASYGNVIDLSDETDGVLLIVSSMVRMALPDRHDLVSPGDLIRDDKGNIIGCKNLLIN